MDKLCSLKQDIILGTDQNFDFMKIESNTNCMDLLNSFIQHGFTPLITKPIRIIPNSATLIDNLYIKQYHHTHVKTGILNIDISDHFPIFTILKSINSKTKPTKHKHR